MFIMVWVIVALIVVGFSKDRQKLTIPIIYAYEYILKNHHSRLNDGFIVCLMMVFSKIISHKQVVIFSIKYKGHRGLLISITPFKPFQYSYIHQPGNWRSFHQLSSPNKELWIPTGRTMSAGDELRQLRGMTVVVPMIFYGIGSLASQWLP